MRAWVLGFTIVAAVASGARAEIYEWRDSHGGQHYANTTQSIPSEYRSTARVMVTEKGGVPGVAPAAQPGVQAVAPGAPPSAASAAAASATPAAQRAARVRRRHRSR